MPARTTFTTSPPPPRSLVPTISTSKFVQPLFGTSSVITPGSSNVHPFTTLTNAPVSATRRTSPWIGVLSTARTTTVVSVRSYKGASTPARVTTSELPPINKFSPEIVTMVPFCPEFSSMSETEATARYVQPPALVTMAPLFETTTTSPTDADPGAATIEIEPSLSSPTSARSPASVIHATSLPPPYKLVPLITTRVPSWPSNGLTSEITPGTR